MTQEVYLHSRTFTDSINIYVDLPCKEMEFNTRNSKEAHGKKGVSYYIIVAQ